MRLEPDLLLEGNLGRRLKGLDRLLLLLSKKLFDGVAHAVGFTGGLGFGLDPEPGFLAWGIANVFHASSNIPYDERGARTVRAGAALSAEDNVPARPSPQSHAYIYSSILLVRRPTVTLNGHACEGRDLTALGRLRPGYKDMRRGRGGVG